MHAGTRFRVFALRAESHVGDEGLKRADGQVFGRNAEG